VALGLALLPASWLVYDLLWRTKFAKKQNGVASGLSVALVIALAYGLTHIFSGRAAFIHVGAVFGTLMVLNVWVHILPAQQQMIDATARGKKPDFSLGKAAKRRSVHNSYMTLPVLFIMLSNHYPATFGHKLNWLVLTLLIVAGAGVRHFMIVGKRAAWVFAPVGAALLATIIMTGPTGESHADLGGGPVRFARARSVISARCVACHSPKPTDDIFKVAPNGVMFDTPEKIKAMTERIRIRVVEQKTMPLGNKTGMTDDERETLARWIEQGAKLD
jgi:uncharacterized membrane protein